MDKRRVSVYAFERWSSDFGIKRVRVEGSVRADARSCRLEWCIHRLVWVYGVVWSSAGEQQGREKIERIYKQRISFGSGGGEDAETDCWPWGRRR